MTSPTDPSQENGSLNILALDTEIFGFPVAEWRWPSDLARVPEAWAQARVEADKQEVRLVSCRVPANQPEMLSEVQRAGFRVIDCLVTLGSKYVQQAPLEPAFPLREAEDRDVPELEAIAGQAFSTGRYHLDPAFPRELADKRYVMWVKNALTGRAPGTVLVAEHEGAIAGFLVHRLEGDLCEGQLACVNPKFKNNVVMVAMVLSHGTWLRARGIRKTRTRISIGLMQAIRINLSLKSDLHSADYILHWHSPVFPLR